MKLTTEKLKSLIKETITEVSGEGREMYALVSISYEPHIVVRANSMEEMRRELEDWLDNPMAELEAIFYADVIEGEL